MSKFIPAFPCGNQPISEGRSGMTLRDYFAAQAIPEMMQYKAVRTSDADGRNLTFNTREVAEACYIVADAMIEAREAKEG